MSLIYFVINLILAFIFFIFLFLYRLWFPCAELNEVIELWSMIAPVYLVFAVITGIICVLSVSLNGLVCLVFCKNRRLLNAPNIFIASVALSDLFHSITILPLIVITNTQGRWIYGDSGCKIIGFIATWNGLTSLMNLSVASYERYHALVFLYKSNRSFSRRKAVCFSLAMWMYALFWSLMPLCGWSEFEQEGIGTSCSVRWKSRDKLDVSYNICLLVACFVLPVSVIIISYFKICREINKSARRAKKTWGKTSPFTRETFEMERKMVSLFGVMTVAFLVAWTPYAVVSLISMVGRPDVISDITATIPAYFAKSSGCYNPIVYFFLCKRLRQQVKLMVRTGSESSSTNFRRKTSNYSQTPHYPEILRLRYTVELS